LNASHLQPLLQERPYPILFATVTGSHAFGYANTNSDHDVHGVHLLPLAHVLGFGGGGETIERKIQTQDVDADLATHDLKKFVMLLLKGNGNVLEDLYSPQIVVTSPVHQELMALGQGCITKKVANHYKGMAFTQQRRLASNETKKVIHMYRCLLMGIHAMRYGCIEMDLASLATAHGYSQLTELIQKRQAGQDGDMTEQELTMHLQTFEHLVSRLEDEQVASRLPEESTTRADLETLIIRIRLESR
jgi:predicted nucleotidyltransferase